jgi:hypothetical protein
MFNRPRMPIINLPLVITPSEAPAIKLQMGRREARSAWVDAVESLNNRQAALKERAEAAARTPDWGSAVGKLSVALKEQAAAARASSWAKTVAKLRNRQMALKQVPTLRAVS